MAKNQTYKAFTAYPTHVMDLNGVLLDGDLVLSQLVVEVRAISAYATYVARNDTELEAGLARATAVQAATAGRQAGIVMPEFLSADKKDENGELLKDEHGNPIKSKTGRSRKEWLVRHNAVTAFRSWQERVKAVNGESSKHVSQGWKRTMDASPPSYGEDFINLGATDKQYAVIENDPFIDGEIVLKMVIQGVRYRLIFPFDNTRFPEGKAPCLSLNLRIISPFSSSLLRPITLLFSSQAIMLSAWTLALTIMLPSLCEILKPGR